MAALALTKLDLLPDLANDIVSTKRLLGETGFGLVFRHQLMAWHLCKDTQGYHSLGYTRRSRGQKA